MRQRTVLITGASRGIGAAMAETFAQAGYLVGLNYNRSEDRARKIAERYPGQVVLLQGDVTDSGDVSNMVSDFAASCDHIDALVCNAGVAHIGLLSDLPDREWETLLSTNLTGTLYACREVIPYMVRRHSGSIITVSSMWGQVGASCEAAYSATKAGVIGLTKALSKELGPSGIRVNCIAPGMIDTEMNAELSEEDVAAIAEEIPLGRIGTPAEVAKVCLFLASDDASYVTGQVIGVNGGVC